MFSEKQQLIIETLKIASTWVSAEQLSELLSVSTRSIRMYISQINNSFEDSPLIVSSKLGYKINKLNLSKIKQEDQKPLPSTPESRIDYLLSQLISFKKIDIYEIAENLHVSLPTIERDIINLRSKIKPFNISVQKKDGFLSLKGSEESFRKLTIDLIRKETNDHFLSIENLQSDFKKYDLEKIKKIIVQTLKDYGLFINAYTINSIILHIVIAIDRVKQNNFVNEEFNIKEYENNEEYKATLTIAKILSNEFGVRLTKGELNYLTILLITKTNVIDIHAKKSVNMLLIEDKYIRLVKDIINKVSNHYFIPISDEEFLIKFSLHVKNLINRARYKQNVSNPLTKKIKNTYPLIYDMSVFVSNEIQQKENITISEDEITYISFHLGTFFNRAKELEKKVTCAVIYPEYYNMHIEFTHQLEKHFEDSLEISRVITSLGNNLKGLNEDLIISIIDLVTDQKNTVIVTPFFSKKDSQMIEEKIESIKSIKMKERFSHHISNFFSEELFEKNIYLNSEFDYIDYMGEKLLSMNYIDKEFIEMIKVRERMSSTAFNNNIAMPHAMEMKAKKTAVFIILNDSPTKWGENIVQIITLIVMNEEEKQDFREVFDLLIEILSEPQNVTALQKAKDYKGFMDELINLI